LTETSETPAFFSEYPDTGETGESYDVEMSVDCFRCGAPAIGTTWFMTGTKEGVPLKLQLVNVCGQCYETLKEKAATRSRLSDPPVEVVN